MGTDHKISPQEISLTVARALSEDIGSGDISAELIAADKIVAARIVSKDHGVLCGTQWAESVFGQLDKHVSIDWSVKDGGRLQPGDLIATLNGPARAITTGERSALNFLQTLSATSTLTRQMVEAVRHTNVTLLDTRKTLPGLRVAQKYAVTVGGGANHRMGLYDAFLIKENHVAACGGISAAIARARALHPDKTVEIEVRNLSELAQALHARADTVMLDNFRLSDIAKAVESTAGQCKLEASGGIDGGQLAKIAETGVDYISIGALTKNCRAFDMSLLID